MNRRLPKRHVWACDCQGWSRDERCEALDAEVKDLKVRLKAARLALDWADCEHGAGYCEVPTCNVCRGYRATDLRVKNWRKP